MALSGFLLLRVAVFASLYLTVSQACGGHDHGHMRKRANSPITAPTRPLVWGDINFLSTTDTHGWLLGHQEPSEPEPNYSGDFGDFASFVINMKQIADKKGVDLLLVDSGDLHDGTGLSDGFPVGQIDGQEVCEIIFCHLAQTYQVIVE